MVCVGSFWVTRAKENKVEVMMMMISLLLYIGSPTSWNICENHCKQVWGIEVLMSGKQLSWE